MANYKLYLSFELDTDFFEVNMITPEVIQGHIDEMPTSRFDFSEINIKNEPFSYLTSAIDKYKLYDIIKAKSPESEIKFKITSDEFPEPGIKGYFGEVDCNIDNDSKIITVKPTILDEYTPILESREKEIVMFDDHNIVKNPKFSVVTGLMPDDWTKSSAHIKLERGFLDDNTEAEFSDEYFIQSIPIFKIGYWQADVNNPNVSGITSTEGYYYECNVAGSYDNGWGSIAYEVGDRIVYNAEYNKWIPENGISFPFPSGLLYFSPTVPLSVAKNSQMLFDFNYFLRGSSDRRKKLYSDVLLWDSNSDDVYCLLPDGNWRISGVWDLPILYGTHTPIPDFSTYNKSKSIVTQRTPVAGTIYIRFYRPMESTGTTQSWDADYKLIIANVLLSVAEIELKTIKVKFDDANFVTASLGSPLIQWTGKGEKEKYFGIRANGNDIAYYIDSDTGAPTVGALNIKDYGSPKSASGLMLQDLMNTFDSVPSNRSYKFELSSLTMFLGEASGDKHRWYADAEFTREEVWKLDPPLWVDDDGYTEEKLPPPALGSGWAYTEIYDPPTTKYEALAKKRLWVRKPFNGITTGWIKDEVIGDSTLKTWDNSFQYRYMWKTKKDYPVDAGRSIYLNTAIDLRKLIQKVYCESDPNGTLTGKNVYSSFLWNDCELGGALPDATLADQLKLTGTNLGSNYVTLTDKQSNTEVRNPLNNIVVIHTYDLRQPADQKAGDENAILKVTFKKLMDDLIVMSRGQIYWFVDSTYNLHIEHIKHFDRVNTPIDMTIKFPYIRNYEKWKYDKSKMYSLEEYEMKNAGYADFKTTKVTFGKLPSNKRGEDTKVSFATAYLTTDIQYCVENPTGIDNGIILLAYDYDAVNDENIVRYGHGQKSKSKVINGDLSLASFISEYGKYEGTWKKGWINEENPTLANQTTFNFTKRTVEGKEITFKGIIKDNLISNKIGIGLVKSKTIFLGQRLTKVVLNHRYEDYISQTTTGDVLVEVEKPTVTTNLLLMLLSDTSISAGGNVTSDGGAALTEVGVCYSAVIDPTVDDTKVTSAAILGVFDATITGLTEGTTYYYRAYATNSEGTSYGVSGTFKITLPVVTTSYPPSDITDTSAIVGGEVVSEGITSVTERGIEYGLSYGSMTNKVIGGSGIGAFSISLDGLSSMTAYYFRAYAISSTGTVYGVRIRFSTN